MTAARPGAPAWVRERRRKRGVRKIGAEDRGGASHILLECREPGVGFALDDFGTGCGSASRRTCMSRPERKGRR